MYLKRVILWRIRFGAMKNYLISVNFIKNIFFQLISTRSSECITRSTKDIAFFRTMMMMNCFCGMVDRRKDHCQRSSPSRISDTPWAGFEPAQNLSSGLVEWSFAVVITTTPWRYIFLRHSLFCKLLLNRIIMTKRYETWAVLILSKFPNINIPKFIISSANSFFNVTQIKFITKLQLGLSHLGEDKIKHSFHYLLNPISRCRLHVELTLHFLLHSLKYILKGTRSWAP